MSGSGVFQYMALDRMKIVFVTREVKSRTVKADVLALLLLKRLARYLVDHREVAMKYPTTTTHHRSIATRMQTGQAT